MAPTFTPSRQTFRETLAQVAAQAKTILPAQVNGRLESAVKLVLAGDVFFLEDGTATVGSASDPGKTYTLAGNACDCQDFAYGQAPQGWCQHRIASNLARSVERVLARRDAPPMVPDLVEPWPDNDFEEEPAMSDAPLSPPPVAPVVPPLGEAPASCNAYVLIGGHKVQVTLRDTDEQRMLARLTVLLAQYPPAPDGRTQPQAPRAPQAAPVEPPVCPYHGAMKASTKAPGTWYCASKMGDGSYCREKWPQNGKGR